MDGDIFFRCKEAVGERGGGIRQSNVGVGFGITAGPEISAGQLGNLDCRWSIIMEASTVMIEAHLRVSASAAQQCRYPKSVIYLPYYRLGHI